MADNAHLQSEVAAILLDVLKIDVPSFSEDLVESGILDSLKIVELLMQLELQFGLKIQLKDLEIDTFRSVVSMAEFVAAARAAGGSEPEHAATAGQGYAA